MSYEKQVGTPHGVVKFVFDAEWPRAMGAAFGQAPEFTITVTEATMGGTPIQGHGGGHQYDEEPTPENLAVALEEIAGRIIANFVQREERKPNPIEAAGWNITHG